MSNNQAIDRETLVAGGFVPTRYEGQEGEFLVKRVPIERMPEAGKRLVDEDLIMSGMDAVTEICPDGNVQLYIPDADVLDDRQPAESDAGRAMIADAIAAPIAEVVAHE
jgi:hypothetical protein